MVTMQNPRLKLVKVDDVICEEAFAAVMAKNLADIRNFSIRDGDIFLATYPKCGTTWMQYIVWGILNKGAKPPDMNQMMFNDAFPFLEATGTKIAENMKSPRPLKSHLFFSRVPQSPKAKYITVIRNPFDCCISYYHFVKETDSDVPEDLTFDEFFEFFLDGNVLFGDYFDYILGWYEHKNDENVLFMAFEEIYKDHRGTILKVARFLGDNYYQEVIENEHLLDTIQHHSSFDYMKSLSEMRVLKDMRTYPEIDYTVKDFFNDDEKFKTVEFFRKGKVGEFKATLNETQKTRMREFMEERFKETDILDYWKHLL